ncbi:hypothetical protein [Streptomyces lydicamycinicus]|uniref:hypothetical protein n=1 Tax=Streptomyces lydicamycinicus TaxID=1546107 RepID=UPI003C2CE96A
MRAAPAPCPCLGGRPRSAPARLGRRGRRLRPPGLARAAAPLVVQRKQLADLQPLVVCAYNLDDWDDSWGVPVEKFKKEAIEAAAHFLAQQPQAEHD